MTVINLCNEVLENAIGVHRSLEKIEPLNPIDAVAVQAMEELLEYRAIGTIEEFKALKEKSEPKEPIIIDSRLNEVEWKCPVCGLNVIEEPPCQQYCQRCGNKLDWSE